MRPIYNDEIYHFGIKGMKWGHHKTVRTARKDAEEFARAKMFYGTGAGNRRKLIKATVNSRSKDPVYKEEFDKHLAKQDMGKHAEKAKQERLVKDTKESVAKTSRGLWNMSVGNVSRASATAAGLYTIAHMTGMDKKIVDFSKDAMSKGYNIVMDHMKGGVY